ncbi:MAG: tRNA (adenosine(37)-N6)-threonylcarbamoyltransferase complex transferase subunit TsaD [Parachlamydiales bacterium]|nr:tRNA (adenosine(37)-N6)-threonylcarbamoyltransferase complex transferase subunit TsaD [Parachlamydiales bacterium]
MYILGVETTCDETAASIVRDGETILSNVIASQAELHKKFGGVFPELASRTHIENIIPVIDSAIRNASITEKEIDLIAVANTPGLIGSLQIGINTAKALALAWGKPLIGINHVEAHLYASMMSHLKNLLFPAIGVVLSGGHTMLLKIESIGCYHTIASTIDDSIGEAFDKVATILDFSYPGGPEIEQKAHLGDIHSYRFQVGTDEKAPLNFSYSGIKTKVLYTVKGQKANRFSTTLIDESQKVHIAASFQHTVFQDLIKKTLLAADQYQAKALYFGGGVTNNQTLKKMFTEKNTDYPMFWPSPGLSLDNAAMIAGLAYHKYLANPDHPDIFDIFPEPRMKMV